jgi:hypothetical protein
MNSRLEEGRGRGHNWSELDDEQRAQVLGRELENSEIKIPGKISARREGRDRCLVRS